MPFRSERWGTLISVPSDSGRIFSHIKINTLPLIVQSMANHVEWCDNLSFVQDILANNIKA